MRESIASCVAVAILALVSGIPLLSCPFLTRPAHSKPSCHREAPGHGSKCPLSPTLETCPYFITDAKLGVVEAGTFVAAVPAAAVPVVDALMFTAQRAAAPVEWIPSQTDLHVRIRVFLI